MPKINKVAFEFDPFEKTGIDVPRNRREEALAEVAEYIKEEVLSYVGDGESPVSGGRFKKTLKPEYKKRKEAEGGSGVADLELTGEMLDALDVVVKSRNKLSLQIEGDEAPKADGHNNHSGLSSLPERKFIPKKDETLKRDIWQGVKGILEKYTGDEE